MNTFENLKNEIEQAGQEINAVRARFVEIVSTSIKFFAEKGLAISAQEIGLKTFGPSNKKVYKKRSTASELFVLQDKKWNGLGRQPDVFVKYIANKKGVSNIYTELTKEQRREAIQDLKVS